VHQVWAIAHKDKVMYSEMREEKYWNCLEISQNDKTKIGYYPRIGRR
jgi:hypothetical protein